MPKTTLSACLIAPPSIDGQALSALPRAVEWLEVRADLVGDLDPDWLRSHFKGRLLYALRGVEDGGAFEGGLRQRHERLLSAARHYDLVELALDRDLTPDLLSQIPAAKRLLSWRGAAMSAGELKGKFEQLAAVEARFYKLVTTAARDGDELAPLSLLKSLGRSDTIAYSVGKNGFWSRLVAPRLGSPMVFGVLGNQRGVAGVPTVNQLIDDYGLPRLGPLKDIYGIVGDPVYHSLSPRLHNAAYGVIDYPALFVPFHVESFRDFWEETVEGGTLESLGMSIKGLTIASPHKEAAIGIAGQLSPMVQRSGATNIFVRTNGTWTAGTTDPEGVVLTMRERGIRVERRRAAVIGCGGAGRAIAAALDHAGAKVTIVNRGRERGRLAVRLLGLPFVPLSEFDAEGYSVVVNATPVGRDDGQSPFEVERLSEGAVVVDLVYRSGPTPLAAKALALGLDVIDGREVLMTQVLRQFRLMTGREMPPELVREKLGLRAVTSDLIPASS